MKAPIYCAITGKEIKPYYAKYPVPDIDVFYYPGDYALSEEGNEILKDKVEEILKKKEIPGGKYDFFEYKKVFMDTLKKMSKH